MTTIRTATAILAVVMIVMAPILNYTILYDTIRYDTNCHYYCYSINTGYNNTSNSGVLKNINGNRNINSSHNTTGINVHINRCIYIHTYTHI